MAKPEGAEIRLDRVAHFNLLQLRPESVLVNMNNCFSIVLFI